MEPRLVPDKLHSLQSSPTDFWPRLRLRLWGVFARQREQLRRYGAHQGLLWIPAGGSRGCRMSCQVLTLRLVNPDHWLLRIWISDSSFSVPFSAQNRETAQVQSNRKVCENKLVTLSRRTTIWVIFGRVDA